MTQQEADPPPERDWNSEVKGRIKAEMKLRNMTYADLARALARVGVRETDVNLRNKVSRGGFSAVFFVQCMEAMGTAVQAGRWTTFGPFTLPGYDNHG